MDQRTSPKTERTSLVVFGHIIPFEADGKHDEIHILGETDFFNIVSWLDRVISILSANAQYDGT